MCGQEPISTGTAYVTVQNYSLDIRSSRVNNRGTLAVMISIDRDGIIVLMLFT